MSDTFNTLPYWVLLKIYGRVVHDHTLGYCKVELPVNSTFKGEWEHNEACPRVTWQEYLCDGDRCLNYYFLVRDREDDRERNKDIGCGSYHFRRLVSAEIFCKTCQFEVPLCKYVIPDYLPQFRLCYSSPPRWWRKYTEHAVARGERRRVLGEVKKYYNSDYIDDDFLDEDNFEIPKKFANGWWD